MGCLADGSLLVIRGLLGSPEGYFVAQAGLTEHLNYLLMKYAVEFFVLLPVLEYLQTRHCLPDDNQTWVK